MYLKILNGNKHYYYKFNDNKEVFVGRGSKNDIVIIAEGVSRSHLKIFMKNGEFFIEDLETTNGTFINDVKIEPNTHYEFNSFFPVQLGFHAKISLCDESNINLLEKLVKSTKEELMGQ